MNDLLFQPIHEVAPLLRKRAISPVELTRALLDHIEQLEPKLNAFITVRAEEALNGARTAEAAIVRGDWQGPLHGIPIGIKDNIAVNGWPTTCASKILANHVTTYDATVVKRLREAGAVIVGKNNLHEFAMGGTSSKSHFGLIRNPWNLEYVPGGSSGGGAASVSAGEVFAAMGTDGRGSIRTPTSFCGVVGLKPTFGLVSHFGEVPPSSTWMCSLGPICRTVTDAALMLNALAGHDANDPSSARSDKRDYTATLEAGVKGLRLGLVTNYFYDDTATKVREAVWSAAEAFRGLGADVREVELPGLEHISLLGPGLTAESNDFLLPYALEHGEDFCDQNTRYMVLAREFSRSSDTFRALRVANLIRREARELMSRVDLLITPVNSAPAFPIAESRGAERRRELPESPKRESVTGRLTTPFNVLGMPAISIPCAFTAQGLPIGLQIAGRHFEDHIVLQAARAFERSVGPGYRRPAVVVDKNK